MEEPELHLDALQLALQGTNSELKLKLLSGLSNDLQQLTSDQLTPETTEELLLTLKLALKSSNSYHVLAALASLPPLFPLLVPDPVPDTRHGHYSHALKHAFLSVLPASHLGDQKDKVRELARESFVSAARTALRVGVGKDKAAVDSKHEGPWAYVSRVMHEHGFGSKNPKAREQALLYLLAIRSSPPSIPPAPFRPFTPLLLSLLADPDPSVRQLSFSTTVTIFTASSVSPAAKADLKKALLSAESEGKVTKKVADSLVAAVLSNGAPMDRVSSSGSLSSASSKPRMSSETSGSPKLGRTESAPATTSSTLSTASTLAPTASTLSSETIVVPPSQASEIPLVYIASLGDLASEVAKMEPCFADKETEFNWIERDRSIVRLRGMVKAGVATGPFAQAFLMHLKSLLDGIVKATLSLRTTLASATLNLISELSVAFGHALDPLLDPLLSQCLSMAGQTKKIVASASQAAVTSLLTNSAYHLRTLQLLQLALGDKIASGRALTSAHLITFLDVHSTVSRHHIESSGGLAVLEACLKKGLADPNATVKENSRKAFWTTEAIWPKVGEAVIKGLDGPSRKQLEKADPKGRVAAVVGSAAKPARPTSVKAAMLAARAKKAADAEASDVSAPSSPAPSRTIPLRSSPGPSPRQPISRSPRPNPLSSFSTPAAGLSTPLVPLPAGPNSPPTPTQADPTPTALSASTASKGDDILLFTSPFKGRDDVSSIDFASQSSSSDSGRERVRNASLVLPVPDAIVDDAMIAQAAQAEQAAQRLLELADSDAELDDVSSFVPSPDPAHSSSATSSSRAALPHLLHTPARAAQLGAARDIFADSPDVGGLGHPAGGVGKGNWWMKKSDLGLPTPVATPLKPDSEDRLAEIEALVSALQTRQIDAAGVKKLVALSKERPVREGLDADPASEEAERFWESGRRFTKVFVGLSGLLKVEPTSDRKDAALGLLKELVQNQSPCFNGDEMEVYNLLFELREDTSRSTVAAVDAISETFADQTEPLYGLGLLRSSLEAHLARPLSSSPGSSTARAKSYALGLKLLGKFFARLPAEVLEEELPKAKALLKTGLNDAHSGDLRRAAVNALVEAQRVLQDEERLYSMVDDLSKDQKNLLAYYIERTKA